MKEERKKEKERKKMNERKEGRKKWVLNMVYRFSLEEVWNLLEFFVCRLRFSLGFFVVILRYRRFGYGVGGVFVRCRERFGGRVRVVTFCLFFGRWVSRWGVGFVRSLVFLFRVGVFSCCFCVWFVFF